MSIRSLLLWGVFSLLACEGEIIGDGDHVLEFGGEPKSAVLLVEGLPQVSYVEVDGAYLVEGDTAYPPEMFTTRELQQSSLVSLPKSHLWPNGRIPYVFSDNVSAWMKARILDAMQLWSSQTPVRFVEKTAADADYVFIKTWNNSYSYAYAGRTGGKQLAVIQTGLSAGTTRGLVAHELGHTLGLKHEQTRVDRDEHVIVHWENIKDGFGGNFAKYTPGLLWSTYNIGSIMHYGSYSFSKNGQPTITRLDGTTFHENFDAPTKRDVGGVSQMYADAGTP